MEPIISPWTIYLIGLLPSLTFIGFVGTVLCGALYLIALTEKCKDYLSAAERKECDTVQKWTLPIGLVCLAMCVLLPSKETCYQMMVASYVTPENINTTLEGTENLAKRALDLITDSVVKIIKETK